MFCSTPDNSTHHEKLFLHSAPFSNIPLAYTHFFFSFIFISWRLITLQYCSAIHWHESATIYMYSPSRYPFPPPSPPHPSGSSQCTKPEHLSHASNLGWWSVSPLTVYLFQCCSLWTSHPRLLPESQSLFYISVSLFLFCILGYRNHLSKFHIHVLVYCIGLYLSGLLHSV